MTWYPMCAMCEATKTDPASHTPATTIVEGTTLCAEHARTAATIGPFGFAATQARDEDAGF